LTPRDTSSSTATAQRITRQHRENHPGQDPPRPLETCGRPAGSETEPEDFSADSAEAGLASCSDDSPLINDPSPGAPSSNQHNGATLTVNPVVTVSPVLTIDTGGSVHPDQNGYSSLYG
jgi:hypothetical protein